MSYKYKSLAVAAGLTVAAISSAFAADLDTIPVKAKPIIDVPFFFVNDNRLTYAYEFTATDPGVTDKTVKQVFAFTHFDVWAYGTNFINVELLKSDQADPAAPCVVANSGCAGATEFYGLARSTFGWNQLFDTKAFTVGPLSNISFEVGGDVETENQFYAPAKKDLVAGLQFAFTLPYKGYFNVAPLFYKEWGHDTFLSASLIGPDGIPDGNTDFNGTWAVETNYYMDLGFLPENLQYFAISGRAGWYGPKGTGTNLIIPGNIPTKTELNSEPIRLTFDASKAMWGPKYGHFLDVWVAYRYWQNKFGLDHQNDPVCAGNRTCTESSLYSGVSVKF
jgi:hypothetical protein